MRRPGSPNGHGEAIYITIERHYFELDEVLENLLGLAEMARNTVTDLFPECPEECDAQQRKDLAAQLGGIGALAEKGMRACEELAKSAFRVVRAADVSADRES